MRKILFRGKVADAKKWIYGDLLQYAGTEQIWEQRDDGKWNCIVDTGTVCQCTNVPDKNGTKIFEGDIVRRKIFESYIVGVVVWFDIGCCGFYLKHENSYYPIGKDEHTGMAADDEVIGNIFENPEMLEEKITGNVGERC